MYRYKIFLFLLPSFFPHPIYSPSPYSLLSLFFPFFPFPFGFLSPFPFPHCALFTLPILFLLPYIFTLLFPFLFTCSLISYPLPFSFIFPVPSLHFLVSLSPFLFIPPYLSSFPFLLRPDTGTGYKKRPDYPASRISSASLLNT